MARWGEGNFDNDFALDFLAEVVQNLLEDILFCVGPENHSLFCGETRLMPAIDILVTLGRAYPYIVGVKLSDQPINEWKKTYLRMFEERSDMDDEDQARRTIIAETFSNLEELVSKFKEGNTWL